jgi:hypothetical protein
MRQIDEDEPYSPDPGPGGDNGGGTAGSFTTSMFYVYSKDYTPVEAKYLRDDNGNFIMDESAGIPYIVPADFDPHEIINTYSGLSLTNPNNAFSDDAPAKLMVQLYQDFHAAYPGSRFDIQRSYNGIRATRVGEFVPAFTSAASWVYGFATASSGMTPDTTLVFSGLQNIKSSFGNPYVDTSGTYFNAPSNVPDILRGFADFRGGATVSNEEPEYLTPLSKGIPGQAQYWVQPILHDRGQVDETLVQVSTNLDTGSKSVSIQTDDWGVVFGSDGNVEVDWWTNDENWENGAELPDYGFVYDYYGDIYGNGGGSGGMTHSGGTFYDNPIIVSEQPDSIGAAMLDLKQSSDQSSHAYYQRSPSGKFYLPDAIDQDVVSSASYDQLSSVMAAFNPPVSMNAFIKRSIGYDAQTNIVSSSL